MVPSSAAAERVNDRTQLNRATKHVNKRRLVWVCVVRWACCAYFDWAAASGAKRRNDVAARDGLASDRVAWLAGRAKVRSEYIGGKRDLRSGR